MATALHMDARAVPARKTPFVDILSVIMLVFPIYGMFYPLESYLASSAEEATLPFPVNQASLVLIGLFVLGMANALRRQGRLFHLYPLYIYIFVAFASVLWSADPAITILRAARLVVVGGLALTLTQYYSFRKLISLICIAFFLSAAVSVFVSIAFPNIGLGRIGGGYEAAWRGAAIHKNFGGFIFAIGAIFTYYAYRLRYIPLLLLLITMPLLLLMLVKGNSATAMLSLSFIALLAVPLATLQKFESKIRFLLLVIIVALSGTVLMILIANLEAALGAAGRDLTFTGRTEIWREVWSLIWRNPIIGYGYGFWGMESPQRAAIDLQLGFVAAHAHNSWLDIWLQTGIVGLIAMGYVMASTTAMAFRNYAWSNDKRILIVISIVILLLFRSLSEVQFSDPSINGLFWLVWAYATLKTKFAA